MNSGRIFSFSAVRCQKFKRRMIPDTLENSLIFW